MKEKLRIGYQGDIGSNSHEVAKRFYEKYCLLGNRGTPIIEAEFVPLVTSENVSKALDDGSIHFGVMALHNNIGGTVKETEEARKQYDIGEPIDVISMGIHHNLYAYPGAEISDLHCIASHEQALIQTRRTRSVRFPGLASKEIEDTAIGAAMLRDGRMPADCGVICPREAGEMYQLDLLAANLEDEASVTTFGVFSSGNVGKSERADETADGGDADAATA